MERFRYFNIESSKALMGSMSHFFGQCLLVLFWIDDYNSLDLPLNSHNLQQSVKGITVLNVGLKIKTF